jgi:hypothetical protein
MDGLLVSFDAWIWRSPRSRRARDQSLIRFTSRYMLPHLNES